MKQIIFLITMFLGTTAVILSQSPHAFKYQAIARDQAGNILSNWEINLRVSILQENQEGEEVYVESHRVQSNIYGLINLVIGEGEHVLGDFENIAWDKNRHYIKLEMDISGDDQYQEMGTSQLYAVPYALYAEQAGSISPHNMPQKKTNSGSSPPSQSFGGQSSGSRIGSPNSKFPAAGDSYLNALEGKVGIGTDSPEYMLDVAGDINIAGGSTLMMDEITVMHNKGTGNFFAGDSAGASSASSSGNSGFGYHALFSNTAGINNSAFGYKAGWNALGSGNLFLGHKAGYFENGSDKLYIDNSNTTTPLIYGDFSVDSLVVHGNQSIYQQNMPGKPNLFVSHDDGYSPIDHNWGIRGIFSSVSSTTEETKISLESQAYGNGTVLGIVGQAESLSDQGGFSSIGVYGKSEASGITQVYGTRGRARGRFATGVDGVAEGSEDDGYLSGVTGVTSGHGANSFTVGVYGGSVQYAPNCFVCGLYGWAVSHGGPPDSTWAGYFEQNLYSDKIAAGVTYKSPSVETQVHVRNTTDDNFGILVNAFDTLGSSIGLHTAKSKYAGLVKNAYFNSGWYRFDESTGAFKQEITPTGDVRLMVCPADDNPIIWNYGIFIKNTGNVGIGTTTPDQKLSVLGNASKSVGGGTWATYSDERLKTNIEHISDALDKVCRLEGVSFEWKDQEQFQEGIHMGLIAQDVEKVIPEWVFEDQSGYKMFQPEGFEGLIVEAIKEQQQIIDKQQSQIITQQQEINKLKELVEELLYSD